MSFSFLPTTNSTTTTTTSTVRMLPTRRSESHSPASRCKSAGHSSSSLSNGFIHSIPTSAASSTQRVNHRQGSLDQLIFKLLTGKPKCLAKVLGGSGVLNTSKNSVAIQTTPIVERDVVSSLQNCSENSKPRITNITFSTVTSATGLPTVPAEPNKARSSSYWKTEASHSQSSNNNDTHGTSVDLLRKLSVSRKESGSHVDTVVTTIDGQRYDTKELDSDPDFQEVAEWAFPIFQISRKYPKTVLSRLTYNIFQQAELFRIFKVSPLKFFNFFHSLEKGYWEIPYHNRIHAADVLHGCYYLSVHPVRPQFGVAKSPDSLLPAPQTPAASIMSQMSTLELMALFTAAAMHDYDHPGRTNAFLVQVEDKKAILYNDRSVLENHHAAESWKLLCRTENHFIENLDPAEMKRFRYLVLEYILATDLKQHFEIIMTFNDRIPDMDLQVESDRLLVGKLLIKMADINSPTKPYGLHRQWTDRICEEFYEQGDDERKRGLTITPYMDRGDAQVAKLQDSFIAHVVSPLAQAMNESGLLPILPGLENSELWINMNHNHRKWKEEIESTYEPTTTCNGGSVNGVIEEESASTSDSPDPRRDSPSLDSELSQ
uniref:Phosphodiesterase n=1 Tax=Caenorhabditis japonica TaxID=281687 RepID=A0A8R1E333_CAEJA